jgi:hypothetical protein
MTVEDQSSQRALAIVPEQTMAPDADGVVGSRPRTLYERLSAPFETTFTDTRGGVELEYVTGEQIVTRLNTVLGVYGWSFTISAHDTYTDADEVYALGRMIAWIPDDNGVVHEVVREQFGSQKLKRSKSTGKVLDIGFDLKGAGTDALKKCASLLGVGLYLMRKDETKPGARHYDEDGQPIGGTRPQRAQQRPQQRRPVAATERLQPHPQSATRAPVCVQCGEPLQPLTFQARATDESGQEVLRDVTWTAVKLAEQGKRKHHAILCAAHYGEANRLLAQQSA